MRIKNILLLVLSISLMGCMGKSEVVHTTPVYENCIAPLEKLLDPSRYDRAEFDIRRFTRVSEAHDQIIGFVEVRGVEGYDLEVTLNTIREICHPRTRIGYSPIEASLEAMLEDYRTLTRHHSEKEVYLDLADDEFIIWYNDKKLEWWE